MLLLQLQQPKHTQFAPISLKGCMTSTRTQHVKNKHVRKCLVKQSYLKVVSEKLYLSEAMTAKI